MISEKQKLIYIVDHWLESKSVRT